MNGLQSSFATVTFFSPILLQSIIIVSLTNFPTQEHLNIIDLNSIDKVNSVYVSYGWALPMSSDHMYSAYLLWSS